MNMESLYKIEEMCCRELDKLSQRGDLSSSALQQAAMLVDTVKDIRTIDAMDQEGGEYSQTGYGSYDGGGSYAGRRGHYVRAHYSRDGYTHGGTYAPEARGRYSRDAARDEMIQRMESMMDQAPDQSEAAAYKRAIDQLRNA